MSRLFKKIQVSQEIPSVELLRGFASMVVCFFHLCCGNPRFLPRDVPMRQIAIYGFHGVEIFFVISGFIIPYAMYSKNYSIKDFPVFLKKRIIRIEPPYLISVILVIVLNFVSTLSPYYRGAPFSIDWLNLAEHFAYLNVFTGGKWLNVVYWTLAIEFQYYLLIALAFGLLASHRLAPRLLFFVCFLGSSFLKLPESSFIFEYASYFMAGILLFQLVYKIISPLEFGLLTGINILLIFYRGGLFYVCLPVLTLLTIAYVNKVPRFLRYLGTISYSLYLLHVPIGGRIINIAEVKIHNVFLRECIVIIAFLICVGAAALFYRYIEKIFKKYSSAIRYNHHTTPILKNALE